MTFEEACMAMRQGRRARPAWFANDDPLWFVVHRDFLPQLLHPVSLPIHPAWQSSEFFSVRFSRFDYAEGYMSVAEFGPLALAKTDCEWELYELPPMMDQ